MVFVDSLLTVQEQALGLANDGRVPFASIELDSSSLTRLGAYYIYVSFFSLSKKNYLNNLFLM